jgi:uncharacterized membrane-anchored protein
VRPDDHPLRQWAVDEMHLRRFAPVSKQCEIYQAVRLIDVPERQKEDARLEADRPFFDSWRHATRYAIGQAGPDIHFLWERHTEASTLTLIFAGDCPAATRAPYLEWLEGWTGVVIRATRVFVIPDEQDIDALLSRKAIDLDDLVSCHINAGLRIWSDFGIHDDGYGRLIVTAGDVNEAERGRIIQRVQEVGNYRNMAMMGFPTAQKYGPVVDTLEQKLSDHANRMAQSHDDDDDDELLQQLADISAQLEMIRSGTEFRLSATTAYAEIAADRLQALQVKAIPNFQSLDEFTERRLVPAARTCSVFRGRLVRIAERISSVMHTLDVRVDTRIKAQNLVLTKSMERSTQLQLRLQTLVEGLSIIAAAYYAVGLIAHVIKGIAAIPKGNTAEIIIGASTLPVVLLIYLLVHRLKGSVLKETYSDQG